jgi:hypothetical protein
MLVKLEFSQQIFKKSSNIKFHENRLSGNRVVPREQRQTDRQTDKWTDTNAEVNGRFSQFCERSEKCTAEFQNWLHVSNGVIPKRHYGD